jgi:small conductance mechanosensitive channel
MAFTLPFGQILVAFMILVVALVLGRTVEKVLLRFFSRLQLDRYLAREMGLSFALERTISHVLSYFIYFGGFVWALEELGFSVRVLQWVFVVFLSVLVVLALLGFKDFLPNFFAGFYILATQKIKVGTTLRVGEVTGTVVGFSLVETRIVLKNKDVLFIPNSLLLKQVVVVRA